MTTTFNDVDTRPTPASTNMAPTTIMSNDRAIALSVDELKGLDRAALQQCWRSAFGQPPPPRLSQTLMVKALIHDLQVKAFGGLSTRTVRALKAMTKPGAAPPIQPPARGTRLVREWNGTLHEVEALDEGYLWQGNRYRSLSAIARAITGTKWSGPRFFGIRSA